MTASSSLLARVRRQAGAALERTPQLKRAAKALWYWSHDPLGRGRPLSVGGVALRVPARFAGPPWTDYELPSTTEVARWLADRPGAALLDIGCSVGVYSALALALSPRNVAYAFDADPVSLKATQRLCRFVGVNRLHCIHGFVSERSPVPLNAAAAIAQTARLLALPAIVDDPERCSYVCIDDQEHPNTPTHAIDVLFAHEPAGRPWLVKCDVEGAELLVLRGLSQFARQHRPQLLISVHAALQGFGFTSRNVSDWMTAHGYTVRILSVDHEEHWWCTPASSPR